MTRTPSSHPCPRATVLCRPSSVIRRLSSVLCLLSSVALADTHYVSLTGGHIPPYTNWAMAATNIQDAVDAAVAGDTVLVTNGIYNTGGRVIYGNTTNRVAIARAITVTSLNGPEATVIEGLAKSGTKSVRCVYAGSNAVLNGFTLTGGGALDSGSTVLDRSGGGAWCEASAVLSNCVLSDNYVGLGGLGSGGGSYGGTLFDCVFKGNTAIDGGGAYRSTLYRCVLTGNAASPGVGSGGGAHGSTLYNCMLISNTARFGGGSSSSVLYNCTLTYNAASPGFGQGGGAYRGSLNNCTLIRNSAFQGGGARSATQNNCIVYYNTADSSPNYLEGTIRYSCTTPNPGGLGNTSNEPGLVNISHLSLASPCVGAGTNAYATGVDIDGEAWGNPPSMGCDEVVIGALTGVLIVAVEATYTNVTEGIVVNFSAHVEGRASAITWDFGDGTPVSSNLLFIAHAFGTGGVYGVELRAFNETYPSGVAATVTISVLSSPVYYVAKNNPDPSAPYLSWATAATNLQEAIDAAAAGGLVLVSNGVYDAGGRAVAGILTNRAAIDKPLVVRSVNGPAVTIIQGAGSIGSNAVRCAFVGNDAVLSGFTLTNGHTRNSGVPSNRERSGGGAWCEALGVLSNCWIIGNVAGYDAGGCYSGTLYNCILRANMAGNGGGGFHGSTLYNCTISGNLAGQGGGGHGGSLYDCALTGNMSSSGGGGSYGGRMFNCTLTGNSAGSDGGGCAVGSLSDSTIYGNSASRGGGAFSCNIESCALARNTASSEGGGSHGGTLINCTLTGNSADFVGGGSFGDEVYNSIVYFNSAPLGPNHSGSFMEFSCTTPHPGGGGNIADPPRLASLSHLSSDSPCLGAGLFEYTTGPDLDGEEWLDPPSMGCDEIHPGMATGDLSVAISLSFSNVAVGYPLDFTAWITGRTTRSEWFLSDGLSISNQPYLVHAFPTAGIHSVVLQVFNETHPGGVSATVQVHVAELAVHFVALNNNASVAPFTNWISAATNIQDAIDAASQVGALILVSNGVYESGGRVVHGAMTNRIAVTKPVTVQSVNGPSVTVIRGAGPILGNAAVRCAFVGSGAALVGFTLTNGFTRSSGDVVREQSGGGAWCQPSARLSNCVITGSSCRENGGGVFGGTLHNCTLAANSANFGRGGGSYIGTLHNSILSENFASSGGGSSAGTLFKCHIYGNDASSGGGVEGAELHQCILALNTTGNDGGGAYQSTLLNCLLAGNAADHEYGGGAAQCSLLNCTIAGNTAFWEGGTSECIVYNCIEYFNQAVVGPHNSASSEYSHSCTTPMPTNNIGNITNDPRFVDAPGLNYDLLADSPCIDAGVGGTEVTVSSDIAGNPRLLGARPDLGAYEFRFEARLNASLVGPFDPTSELMRVGSISTNSSYVAARGAATNAFTNAVDWVQVSVRPSPTSAPAAFVAAILLADGRIVMPDGGTNILIEAKGNQHVVLQHRNHLGVMTAEAVLTNRYGFFDFSTNVWGVLGTTNSMLPLGNGKWGLIPGDADGDGAIRAADEAVRHSQEGP